ncbi:MAG: hypothetical protein IJ587_00275, partial [Synergistaceae bacterium]|nr:hypothetical protein [Synergistaceae bacterium]
MQDLDEIEIISLGTANLDFFKQFLLESGFAYTDDNGNVTTRSLTVSETFEIFKKYAEFRKKKKQQETDLYPVIKTKTHKSEIVILERSKVGRKLQNDDDLPNLYKDGIIFPTYEYKTKKGIATVDTIVSLSYEQVKEWEYYIPAFQRLKKFDIEILA